MKILLATNNVGKVERYKKLLVAVDKDIEIFTPKELGLEMEVEETGKTLEENAKLKVEAFAGKVDMPILGNDTGFYVEGEGLVMAPKRVSLSGKTMKDLTKEEIQKTMLDFWKGIAKKHGGKVDAAWIEAFAVLYPSGELKIAESRREVLLTDIVLGPVTEDLPVRALYYSKVTGKPAVLHTKEEELLELKPITDALREILKSK